MLATNHNDVIRYLRAQARGRVWNALVNTVILRMFDEGNITFDTTTGDIALTPKGVEEAAKRKEARK